MRLPSLLRALGFCLLMLALPHPALAQCIVPFEQGKWTNIDAATRGITRIEVTFSCNDQVLCGVDGNGNVTCTNPGPPFQLHLWGKCSPADCDWGMAGGNDRWVGSTKWVFAFYDQGFARRYVYIKPSVLRPGTLYLWMYSAFTDRNRSPYIFTGWYHK